LCITKGSLDDHLLKLQEALIRLRRARLKVNANKCSSCATETEYLGYVLTREGIKPQPKKVQAILVLQPPQTVKQLCTFLGMVQYYRDLWAKRSEILSPLTSLVGECGTTKALKKKKVCWNWEEIHQKAFDNVTATIARDVVFVYPDFGQIFEVFTDSSKHQLGEVITQNNRPLAFFSRKLSPAQMKYHVTKQELLAIVETLKEFKGMLWCQRITIYTDHQNLIQDALGLTSNWVYRWRLILEEYGPTIVYIKGIHNTVADAISNLDYKPVTNDKDNCMTLAHMWCHYTNISTGTSKSDNTESMNFVFAHHSMDNKIFPLTVLEIAEAQFLDTTIGKLFKEAG
jgi:hypothetical protein